jgi:EAL domain-containing protein (putative c-di-GMP-specific phosphodiesterase class I)
VGGWKWQAAFPSRPRHPRDGVTPSSSTFTAHGFARVAEVEAALTRIRPDVIILDLSLERSDAIEVMQSLAAARFGGAVLLASGHDAETLDGVRTIGERLGLAMLPPIHKPFRLETLRSRLEDAGGSAAQSGVEANLEAALRNNWLELWYQPKIDLGTLQIVGAEALIRLRHPERGVVSPAEFLPPPGHPLNQPLTDFVVRRSLADWASFGGWPAVAGAWPAKRLAINVPASILHSPDFVRNLRRHLAEYPNVGGLIVEITESEALDEPELAHDAAVQLKLHNVDVSIDDFGAGHSTFARLEELPFVELKLDRSYVTGCAIDQDKRWICRTVVELAHRRGLRAVAEGVETADDLRALAGMRYDMAQGFHFARPMESGAFARALAGRRTAPQMAGFGET